MLNYDRIHQMLTEEYTRHAPKSAAIQQQANKIMVDGGSHSLRLIKPFPPRIRSASGSYITDQDGHKILDFWQGHYANILGHNSPVITSVLAEAFANGFGLQTGFTDESQVETAGLISKQTGCEKIRFTTSGTLATMYAVLLSRAYTGRDFVLKVGGGWHGAHPWVLKGISFHEKGQRGYASIESAGLQGAITGDVLITPFNQTEILKATFEKFGDRIACFIVEPFIGAGGLMWASKEFIQEARNLTEKYGAVLIFDEVIAGFRFRAGDTGRLFGVQPDLVTFGKIIGGGMPVALVGGRNSIMQLAGREGGNRVKFSGGTYSAHPSSILASKVILEYLVEHESEIYPQLETMAEHLRKSVEDAFARENIFARCTGYGRDGLPGSSLNMIVFPYNQDFSLGKPEDIYDPEICDVTLGNEIIQLALLLENVHVVHGLGALATTHTLEDIGILSGACQRVARKINSLKNKPH